MKDKWLEGLINQPLFQHLPAQHQKAVVEHFELCPIREGVSPVVEGDKVDYVYVVKKGSFRVDCHQGENGDGCSASLGVGQWFGEEAAITGNTRNAHVTALENSVCYRIPRVFFVKHIVAPMIKRVQSKDAMKWVKAGARVFDITSSEVYRGQEEQYTTNLPLSRLHHVVGRLKRNKKYLVKANCGPESLVAVFILLKNGFQAYLLNVASAEKTKEKGVDTKRTEEAGLADRLASVRVRAEEFSSAAEEKAGAEVIQFSPDANKSKTAGQRKTTSQRKDSLAGSAMFDHWGGFTQVDSGSELKLEGDDDDQLVTRKVAPKGVFAESTRKKLELTGFNDAIGTLRKDTGRVHNNAFQFASTHPGTYKRDKVKGFNRTHITMVIAGIAVTFLGIWLQHNPDSMLATGLADVIRGIRGIF